jgi:hypothetical protein
MKVALHGLLPIAAAACTLAAPSDRDLMGDDADAGAVSRPRDGGANSRDATSPQSVDGSFDHNDGGVTDTTPTDSGAKDTGSSSTSPACAACQKLSPQCLSVPDCECLPAVICKGVNIIDCSGVGDQMHMACAGVSCNTSQGKIVCVVANDACPCN